MRLAQRALERDITTELSSRQTGGFFGFQSSIRKIPQTHQRIKDLESISLGTFIQNTKEGVQGVLEKLWRDRVKVQFV